MEVADGKHELFNDFESAINQVSKAAATIEIFCEKRTSKSNICHDHRVEFRSQLAAHRILVRR